MRLGVARIGAAVLGGPTAHFAPGEAFLEECRVNENLSDWLEPSGEVTQELLFLQYLEVVVG